MRRKECKLFLCSSPSVLLSEHCFCVPSRMASVIKMNNICNFQGSFKLISFNSFFHRLLDTIKKNTLYQVSLNLLIFIFLHNAGSAHPLLSIFPLVCPHIHYRNLNICHYLSFYIWHIYSFSCVTDRHRLCLQIPHTPMDKTSSFRFQVYHYSKIHLQHQVY